MNPSAPQYTVLLFPKLTANPSYPISINADAVGTSFFQSTFTGFDELDALIGGWDVKEELATIVARTGMGKSWLLLKCASAAAKQGKIVGIYSGEMSENKVGYRLDTLMGNFSNGALIHGGASVKNEYRKYLDNLKENVPGKIFAIIFHQ